METVELLKVIWVGAFAAFLVMEIVSPGFIMLPFSIGSLAAAIPAFMESNVAIQLAVFLVVTAALFFALRPLGKKLNSLEDPSGAGANRLVGERGVVIEAITENSGIIRVESEEWRADTVDGKPLAKGTPIDVIEVRGTRVMVKPVLHTTPRID